MKQGKVRHGMYLAAALGLAAAGSTTSRTPGRAGAGVRRRSPLRRASRGPSATCKGPSSRRPRSSKGWSSTSSTDYSDEAGPWTRVFLSNVRVLFGDAPSTVEIRHFGGPLPSGRLMVAAELPVFVHGKEYIVFLRNGEWNVSPVVGDLALRVEPWGGGEVLVNSDGQAVTRVGAGGVEFGPTLFDGPERDGSAPKDTRERPAEHREQADRPRLGS